MKTKIRKSKSEITLHTSWILKVSRYHYYYFFMFVSECQYLCLCVLGVLTFFATSSCSPFPLFLRKVFSRNLVSANNAEIRLSITLIDATDKLITILVSSTKINFDQSNYMIIDERVHFNDRNVKADEQPSATQSRGGSLPFPGAKHYLKSL